MNGKYVLKKFKKNKKKTSEEHFLLFSLVINRPKLINQIEKTSNLNFLPAFWLDGEVL